MIAINEVEMYVEDDSLTWNSSITSDARHVGTLEIDRQFHIGKVSSHLVISVTCNSLSLSFT